MWILLRSRFLQAILTMMLIPTLRPLDLVAQQQIYLLRGEMLAVDFEARQSEYQHWKLEERRKVPSYNAQLGGVIVEFHKHLSKDQHYLVANCPLCRKYLSEIKSYSRKLEQAMK